MISTAVAEENSQDGITPGKIRHGKSFRAEEPCRQASEPVVTEVLERIIQVFEDQLLPTFPNLVFNKFPPYSSRSP